MLSGVKFVSVLSAEAQMIRIFAGLHHPSGRKIKWRGVAWRDCYVEMRRQLTPMAPSQLPAKSAA